MQCRGKPPNGRQVFGNVPCGRLHLHQVHTGQPKHWLVCFYLLLVLYITYAELASHQGALSAITDISSISSSSSSGAKASCPAAGPALARRMRCCVDTHASSSQCVDYSICHMRKHICHCCGIVVASCKSASPAACCSAADKHWAFVRAFA